MEVSFYVQMHLNFGKIIILGFVMGKENTSLMKFVMDHFFTRKREVKMYHSIKNWGYT